MLKIQKKQILVILLGTAMLAGLGLTGWALYWTGVRNRLSPDGGVYSPWYQTLKVPLYAQADPAWGSDPLGPTESTLAQEGCAVTCAAMVLMYHDVDTDPGRLNAFLTSHEGYTSHGWIHWFQAARMAPEKVRFSYEGPPSYARIDLSLRAGNPVIARIRLPNRITHFVVIVGKEGWDYLILDPGAAVTKGVYPLRELGSPIEAIRIYEPVSHEQSFFRKAEASRKAYFTSLSLRSNSLDIRLAAALLMSLSASSRAWEKSSTCSWLVPKRE